MTVLKCGSQLFHITQFSSFPGTVVTENWHTLGKNLYNRSVSRGWKINFISDCSVFKLFEWVLVLLFFTFWNLLTTCTFFFSFFGYSFIHSFPHSFVPLTNIGWGVLVLGTALGIEIRKAQFSSLRTVWFTGGRWCDGGWKGLRKFRGAMSNTHCRVREQFSEDLALEPGLLDE